MSDTSAVPSFLLKIDGNRLPPDQEADVKEILIFEKTDAPSRFEITMNNEGFRWTDNDQVDVGSEVKISLGYKDALVELMVGDITGIRANMRFGQANTVTYLGHSKSHKLVRGRKTQAFTEMTVTEIVEQIAGDAGLTSDVEQITEKRMFTLQKNISDFNYLMSLAERYGCTITDFDGELGFKRQVANSGEDLTLEYNKTLVEFYPTTDVNHLVTEIEVRGWDRAQHQSVRGSKTHSDAGSDGGGLVEESFGAAKQALLDIRVKDQNEADQLALDYLTRNAREYLKGYGVAVGNTDLRAGGIVKIEGIPERYKGKYYIWAVRHRLEIGVGYTSKFFISSNIATQGNGSNTTQSSNPGQGEQQQSNRQNEEERRREQEDQRAAEAMAAAQANAPDIINLQWKNMDDEEVEIGKVYQKVKMTADVENIDDGVWVRLRLYEHDSENENDYLQQKQVRVTDGKIECKWEIEYTEDIDDVPDSDDEDEYTMPEYLFKIAAAQPERIETEDSPVLEVRGWAKIQVLNEETGEPITNKDYTIYLTDGDTLEGTTDDEGYIEQEELRWGRYFLVVHDEEEEEESE